jgi:phosphoribosylformylglycinamidine synthase subunit PurSL
MTARIEVGFKPEVRDAHGCKVRNRIREELGLDVREVATIEVYTVDMHIAPGEVMLLAGGPYCDAVTQVYAVDSPLAANFDWIAEVGYKPGVTDNAGRTALEAASLCLGRGPSPGEKVYTSRQYLFSGDLSRHDAERIVTQILANDLIQRYVLASREEFDQAGGLRLPVPRVAGSEKTVVEEIDIQLTDDALVQLSRERLLALSLDEMRTIKDHFAGPHVQAVRAQFGLQHNPTDAEIEALGQTWSEHCKHKIFNAVIDYEDENGRSETIHSLFATCIKGSTETIRESLGNRDWCVSVFKDNAGVIAWDESYNLVYKVETHNSPSALDPYGGALTGIVGVNRDTIGTGKAAKLIFNTDVFCFASPFHEKELPPRILHPRRILEGVREGVEHGGNKSGIPTVNGSIVFDERFLGKPLVYCGTGGIMPRQILGEPSEVKIVHPGDVIVMAGGRIGKDGIHGATFSSEELHEGSPVTAVQIGDPITQRRMCDFILEARDQGLYRCITDNGAGGLSSSVGEMAQFSGGCDLDLKMAPLKYSGLQPWEILVSESQERMTFAIDPEKLEAFLRLAAVMNVEAMALGSFTGTGLFLVRYGDTTVACLDMAFLHEGLPPMQLKATWRPPQHEEPSFAEPADLSASLVRLLARLNICSKEMVVRQYDHEVQGGSVVKPLTGLLNDGPSDAAVLRPVLSSMRGVVVSHGICPRYSDIDTYHMTACAIDEALRNHLCVGGSLDGIAGLDNFCWCDPIASDKNPDGAYKLAQLVRANRALYDYSIAYTIPCISGKDSMKNDYVIGDLRIAIPPTLLFSIIGSIDDVRKAVTMDVKQAGDLVYILGTTKNELGASEYFAMQGAIGNSVPHVDAVAALHLYRALSRAIGQGLVRSCHDCSDGGLGIALAESSFAGGLGMSIDLRAVPCQGIVRNDYLLFSESQSRFVVTIEPDQRSAFEDCMKNAPCSRIGAVCTDTGFRVTGLNGSTVISTDIVTLKRSWQHTLEWM